MPPLARAAAARPWRPTPAVDTRRRRAPGRVHLKLRLADNHDAHLNLPPDVRADLDARLADPGFCAQVSLEAAGLAPVEYTGFAFTPVPWGPSTPRGAPPEWDELIADTQNYVVINAPPTLSFKAGIGKNGVPGQRVCAIYRKTGPPGSVE